MYEKFGFARQEDSSYEFRLFVPDNAIDPAQYLRGGPCRIVEVRVVGDFQDQVEKSRRNWDYNDGLVLSERDHPNGRLFVYTSPHDLGGQVEVANYQLPRCRVPSNWGCLFWRKG